MLQNIGNIIYAISVIVLSAELLVLKKSFKENAKIAARDSLKEFISLSGSDALDSFANGFIIASLVSGFLGTICEAIWQGSVATPILFGTAFACFVSYGSINAWRYNLKLMGQDLIERVSLAGKNSMSFFLWFTTLSITIVLIIATFLNVYFPNERPLEIEELTKIIVLTSLAGAALLFMIDVSLFALLQALLLVPALTVLIYFYSSVNLVKVLKKIGTARLKNALVFYFVGFTIYLIPWH